MWWYYLAYLVLERNRFNSIVTHYYNNENNCCKSWYYHSFCKTFSFFLHFLWRAVLGIALLKSCEARRCEISLRWKSFNFLHTLRHVDLIIQPQQHAGTVGDVSHVSSLGSAACAGVRGEFPQPDDPLLTADYTPAHFLISRASEAFISRESRRSRNACVRRESVSAAHFIHAHRPTIK